ncbi:MAG TPA: hypothetical protein VF743_06200 [Acidimicrobiales bacterium]
MAGRTEQKHELESLGLAVGSIWVAVAAISVLSPDLVSGSEQQHLPVAAFGTWLWGAISTVVVLSSWASLRRDPERRHLHRALAVGVAAVWGVATLVSIFAPVMVTGTDPTRLPLAALIAPVVATALTMVVRVGLDLVDAPAD